MTRTVVTGGSGQLGRAVVADLLEHGHEVVVLDRVAPAAGSAATWVRVDLTEHGQVLEALRSVDDRYRGVDALVHLAAARHFCRWDPALRTHRRAGRRTGRPAGAPAHPARPGGADHRQRRTVMSTDSADLVARHLPGVEVRGELRGTQTLLSIDRARRVLGREPRHSWRDPTGGRSPQGRPGGPPGVGRRA